MDCTSDCDIMILTVILNLIHHNCNFDMDCDIVVVANI